MTEIVKKRRRWPWAVLAVVVLFIGAPIAWQFRPLNSTERALVGRWQHPLGVDAIYQFGSNRRCTLTFPSSPPNFAVHGSWSASDSQLQIAVNHITSPGFGDEPWMSRLLSTVFPQPARPLQIVGPDQISFDGRYLNRLRD